MELIDAIQQVIDGYMKNSGATDVVFGTVTKANPLEITLINTMLPIPKDLLYLTESVIEKKIPDLKHYHTINVLGHSHTVSGVTTSTDLSESYNTQNKLANHKVVENGQILPIVDGYIIINKGLAVGDKVMMLRVKAGQAFIVLSRVF